MQRRRAYRLFIEDTARLERVVSVRMTPARLIMAAIGLLAAILVAGGLLMTFTPLKRALPGYMKADERTATQEGLLRLDSLRQVQMRQEGYVATIMKALDTRRPAAAPAPVIPSDSLSLFATDSLIDSSPRERRFVSAMHEREKYNLAVLAPLAADRMTFSSPVTDGIVTSESRETPKAEIACPPSAPVVAVADGTVIAAYFGVRLEGGVVVIQHDHGFISRYSGLETPAVGVDDRVRAGQPVAYHAAMRPDGSRRAILEMWHDTDRLIPFRFIGDSSAPDGLPVP